MALYVVIAGKGASKLASAVAFKFDGDFYAISETSWVISAQGMTAKSISDVLGLSDSSEMNGVIFSVTSYWGRFNTSLWEWMKTKRESSRG